MEPQSFPVLGSVSHGTLRTQDLIPTFLDTLSDVLNWRATAGLDSPEDVELVARAQNLIGKIENNIASMDADSDVEHGFVEEPNPYWASDESMFALTSLFDLLDEFAPEGYYFGALEGDGSDYGFWPFDDEENL